jgi:hypothetical protein
MFIYKIFIIILVFVFSSCWEEGKDATEEYLECVAEQRCDVSNEVIYNENSPNMDSEEIQVEICVKSTNINSGCQKVIRANDPFNRTGGCNNCVPNAETVSTNARTQQVQVCVSGGTALVKVEILWYHVPFNGDVCAAVFDSLCWQEVQLPDVCHWENKPLWGGK